MQYRGGLSGTQGMMVAGGPVGKAKLALSQGRADEAERLCRKQLERRPDDASARLVLAQALLQTRQTGEAIEQVRRVIREQPKNVDALLVLSMALVHQSGGLRGVPKEAEEAARRAVQLQPRVARTRVQLAEVLAAKRDLAGARAEVEEACRLEPRLAGAHLMRALILLSDKDPLGAIQASDSALRYDRTLSQAEYIKATALTEVHRYDEALTSLDTAVRQNPTLAGTQMHSLRGRIYFKQRKFSRSYDAYLAAQRLSGRLVRLAPVLAALNMALTIFGKGAPFVLVGVLAALVTLLLFGLSRIPVVGAWIVVALILAIVGGFAFFGVKQLRGSLLPSESSARAKTLGAIGLAVAIGTGLVFAIEYGVTSATRHAQWFTPLTLTIAGVIGLVLGGLAAYNVPRILGRYGGAVV